MDFSEPVPVHPGELRLEREDRRRKVYAVVLLVAGVLVLILSVAALLAGASGLLPDGFVDQHPGLRVLVAFALPAGPLLIRTAVPYGIPDHPAAPVIRHCALVAVVLLCLLGTRLISTTDDDPANDAAPAGPVSAASGPAHGAVPLPGRDGTLGP
ncbi:hypothetical protein [Longispora fulva]|uniref:Uncharacterized protein n=1 Tax=Longispora fulva TaxID=619741 RepID=A0A8J7KXM1_9ACTN|nr:hypothetical protein [Longispora fulva]MBG6138032.1 hypothetical protein [Longispora fulva]